ncbi:hypothetical protein LOTGIDRAFT_154587 [Lottia gigantea]|uniref:Uncharacterized protein n=1 Tax=Lottia gigantea TaxID=225164 RepID=V3ZRX4_LOTGI|nr:hypothetical protein LOTGIDRAFT_154587 [Lottia gigantea]ESO87097.1 hypothetical protein LOTGIDRAFT_154587 [Lottia gigantea]
MMTPESKRVKSLQVEERQYQLSPGLKLLNGNPITPGSSLKGIKELKRTPPRNTCTPSPNHGRCDQLPHDENFDPDEELTGELWYVNLKTPMEEPQQKLSFEPVDFAKVVDGKIPSGNSLARSPVRMSQEEFCPRTPGNTDFEVREVVIEPGSRIPRTPLHYSGRPSAACDLVIHYSKIKARDSTSNSNKKEESKSPKIKKPRKRSMSSNSIPVSEDDHVTVTGEFKTKPKLSRTPLKRLSMQPNEKPVQELQIIDENELDCHSGCPNQIIDKHVVDKSLPMAESHDIFKPSKKLARSPNPPTKTRNQNSNNNHASSDKVDTVSVCADLPEHLKCDSKQVSMSTDSEAVPLCINATPETKLRGKTAKVSQVNSSSKIPRLSPKGNIQSEPDLKTNTQSIVQTDSLDQMNIEHCDSDKSHKLLNEKNQEKLNLNLKSSEPKGLNVDVSNDETMRPLLSPAIKVRKPVKNMIPKGKSLMRTPPSGKYPRDEGEGTSIAPSVSPVEEDIVVPEDPDAIFLAQLRNNDPLPNKKKKPFLKSNKSKIVNNKLKKPAVMNTNAIDCKSPAETKLLNKTETELHKKDNKLTYVVSKSVRTEKDNMISISINKFQKCEPATSNVSSNTLAKPAANNSRKLTYVVQPKPISKECDESIQESDNSLLCLDELCDKSLNLCDSLFNEAFERKNSANTNSKSTAVPSFDSMICPSSPQNDFFPVENILLGDTPSQSVPKSKAVLNETIEIEAKSESDEEFVDASEDFELDNQENRISTSPINRTFEVSTPLSKANSTFDLESKHNGTFDIENDDKAANQTFDVDMSPVHYNEAPIKNDTFDLGKPLNTTFDMEVDDAIPQIVLNLTYDGNLPVKCNKETESPNQTLENTASTVVENITPNKTIETSSVCQTQDDVSIHTESVSQQTKDKSSASCKSNSTSSDGREFSSNSLNSSSIDHEFSGQAHGTAVKNEESNIEMERVYQDSENSQSKVDKVDHTYVEPEGLKVEKPKKAVKGGRKAKVKVETSVLELNSDQDSCHEDNEDTVHACDQEDIPKQRSYKKRGKKDAETEQSVQPSGGEEVNHVAPAKRRGRKPKTKDPEHSSKQEETETIQKIKRGRKAKVKNQEESSEQEETDSIQKAMRGRQPKAKDQEQSSEHKDPESILRNDTEESNEEIGKITTRRGRKPKAIVCTEKNLGNDIKAFQAEINVTEEETGCPKKARCNKPVANDREKQYKEVSNQADNSNQTTAIQEKKSQNLHVEANNCLNEDHKEEEMPTAVDHEKTNEQPISNKLALKDEFIKNIKPIEVSRRHLPRRNQKIISYAESPNVEVGIQQDILKKNNNTDVCTSNNSLQNQGMEVEQASDASKAIEASDVVIRRKPAPRSKLLSLRASFGFVRESQVAKAKDELVIPTDTQLKKEMKDKYEEPLQNDETKAEPVLSELTDKVSDISIHSPTKKLAKPKRMTRQTSKSKIKTSQEVEKSGERKKDDEPQEKPAIKTRRAMLRTKKFAGSYDEDKVITKENCKISETSSERVSEKMLDENTKETEDVQPQAIDTAPQSRSIKQLPRGRKIPTCISPEAVKSNECLQSDSNSVVNADLPENELKEKVLIYESGTCTNVDLKTETNSKIAVSEKQENANGISDDKSNDNKNINEVCTEQIVEKGKVVCFAQESNGSENSRKSDEEVKKARRRSGIPMGFLSKPCSKPPAKESFPGEHSKNQNSGDQNVNISKENSTKSASSKLDSMRKSFGIPSQFPASDKRLSFVCPKPVSATESSMSRSKLVRSQSHKNLRSSASITSDKTCSAPSTKPGETKALPDLKKGVTAQTLSRSTKAAYSSISERSSTGIAEVKTKKAMTRTIKSKPQAKPEETKISPEPTRVRKTRGTKKPEAIPPTSIAKADEEIVKKPATRIKKIPSRKNIRNASTSSVPSPTVSATHSQDSKETNKVELSNPRKRQKCDKQNESVPTKSLPPTDELNQLSFGDEAQQSFCQTSPGPEEMEIDQPSSNKPIENSGANFISNQNQYRDVEEIKDEEENKTSAAAASKKTKRLSFIPSFKGITSAISSKINKKPTDVQEATNNMDNLKLSSPVKGKLVRKPRQAKDGATSANLEEAAPKKRGRKKKVVDEEKENENVTDVPENIQLPRHQTSARSLLAEQIQNVESELEMLTTSEETTKKTESKISKLESKLGKLKIKQESSKSKVCTRSLRSTRLKEQ